MRHFLLMLAVVVLVGCGGSEAEKVAKLKAAAEAKAAAEVKAAAPLIHLLDSDVPSGVVVIATQVTLAPNDLEAAEAKAIAEAEAKAAADAKVIEAEAKATAEAKAAADAKVIEAAIRAELKKPTGELTKADFEKVTELDFIHGWLTDVKGLEKLTQLTGLYLNDNKLTEVPKGLEKLTQLTFLNLLDNPDLTKAQIDELQKALPKCFILSNPKK